MIDCVRYRAEGSAGRESRPIYSSAENNIQLALRAERHVIKMIFKAFILYSWNSSHTLGPEFYLTGNVQANKAMFVSHIFN